jgi:hypothetical protein
MNRYGRLAQEHWAKWRPNELSQIPDREAFFSTLGQEVAAQVEALAAALAGDDPGGEQGLQKQGRLEMARFNAQAQILREMVLLPPEPGHPDAEEEEEPEEDLPPGVIGVSEWMPMVMTPDHPNYHDLDDDPFLHRVTPEELRQQARPPQ